MSKTLFSAVIARLTPEEKAWLETRLLAAARAAEGGGCVGFTGSFEQDAAAATSLRPAEVFALEFASVGDDSFGGGAMLVTATEQRLWRTGLWLAQPKLPQP
jgi:hypothetical protein